MPTQRISHSLDDGRITFEDARETLVEDAVCRMKVDPNDASTKRVDEAGTTYFFCSEDCRDNLASAPEKFTTR
jgi:YHS domain-containing protein